MLDARVFKRIQNHPTMLLLSFPGNPADLPTREVQASQLSSDPCWWEGPGWLKLEEDHWPESMDTQNPPTQALDEIKSEPRRKFETTVNIAESSAIELRYLVDQCRFT